MTDIDQLRNILEKTMLDLAEVLPDALDWRPTIVYMLEILDHQARHNDQQDEFGVLLDQLRSDLETRLNTGSWSEKSE
jgi:hypothetical protein